MKTVRILKQWRGHDPGTSPDLLDELANQLVSEGYACFPVAAEPVAAETVVDAKKPTKKKALLPNAHEPTSD